MKTLVRAGKSRSVEHDAYLRGRQYASHMLIERDMGHFWIQS